jgi:hypothetical protein
LAAAASTTTILSPLDEDHHHEQPQLWMMRKPPVDAFLVNTHEHANGLKSKVAAGTGQTGQARRSDR